ncbi:MAG: flagellar biosynthetic protein FliR [Verrucomicrobia bacterium]|nr:flagellar biosynthetic protein FliR [Verrucomicrobiota bacterium]
MDYLDLYATYPNPMSLLLVFLLGMMRFGPIVAQAPFLGAQVLPLPVKIMEVVTFSVMFLPKFLTQIHGPLLFDITYIALCGKELLIGMLLGFLMALPFYIGSASGTIVDHQRGSSSLLMTDPTLGMQASPIGKLYNNSLIAMFFFTGGIGIFLQALELSFTAVPIHGWINPLFFSSTHTPFWGEMIELMGLIFKIAVMMALPPLVAMFMSDLFLGIANRMATQVPMSFLGWALKSLIGIAILWIGWFFILAQFQKRLFDWHALIYRTIDYLSFGEHLTASI